MRKSAASSFLRDLTMGKWADLFWLGVLAAAIRGSAAWVLNIPPESDYQAYFHMARSLYDGHGLVDPFGNLAYYNAGYPLFLYALFVVFGPSIAVAQVANVALGVLSAWLVFLIARHIGHSRIMGWIAALLWVGYAEAIVYTEYLAKENLVIPILLAILYLSFRLPMTRNRGVWAAVIGALYALQAMVGSAALFALPITLFQIATLDASFAQRIKAGMVLLLSMGLFLSPWLYRNHHVLGAPVLNTNGGFNLYLGNNPAATGYFVSIGETPLGAKWNELRKERGELEASRLAQREAIAHIREHPWESLKLAAYKGIAFWTPPLHDGAERASLLESMVRKVWLAEFLLLAVAALATLARPSLISREIMTLWLYVLGYTAVHMVFYVIFRYRLTIMPVVCLLAAHALWLMVMAYGARKGGRDSSSAFMPEKASG